ncbi:hypothetical protein Droror1_Dr00011827 [Drosera rotundifolia]
MWGNGGKAEMGLLGFGVWVLNLEVLKLSVAIERCDFGFGVRRVDEDGFRVSSAIAADASANMLIISAVLLCGCLQGYSLVQGLWLCDVVWLSCALVAGPLAVCWDFCSSVRVFGY